MIRLNDQDSDTDFILKWRILSETINCAAYLPRSNERPKDAAGANLTSTCDIPLSHNDSGYDEVVYGDEFIILARMYKSGQGIGSFKIELWRIPSEKQKPTSLSKLKGFLKG